MKQYFCNPINFPYRYQFIKQGEQFTLNREAADPSMVLFKEKYYLFPSMTKGFLVSEDMVNWRLCSLNGLPFYDYAPDVHAVGDWLYFCASHSGSVCDFYRTKDPESGIFERIDGSFEFWDPNLFLDDDRRMYFYWGCSNMAPIWGVELNPNTMTQIGEPVILIKSNLKEHGYERIGENHCYNPDTNHTVQLLKSQMASATGCRPEEITDITPMIEAAPEQYRAILKSLISENPYIEGAWMTKYDGQYYLQYASPGAHFNTYSDSVYISQNPLGPFTACTNNPFSYSPGGFCPGAGHGSTMEDKAGNWWHTSTIRISVNHDFERRIGIWPAGFDKDGELFCNQRYGDWPQAITGDKQNPWTMPEWMLLSYGKLVTASSQAKNASNAVDENIQTWWKASSQDPIPWLKIDLENPCIINAIQVNFADDTDCVPVLPPDIHLVNESGRERYIDEQPHTTRWLLETSLDNETWTIFKDNQNTDTDLPHELVVKETGVNARFIRLTIMDTAYHIPACISGLRIFGRGSGNAPCPVTDVTARRTDSMSMEVCWTGNAVGYEVLWGHAPDKLYHSHRVFSQTHLDIRALMATVENYYVRIDSFNENGITEGYVVHADSDF